MSQAGTATVGTSLVQRWRADFPALGFHGSSLAYLDNAATAQKPAAVIDAVAAHDRQGTANIHRGVYRLAAETTAAYEAARGRVASFLGAKAEEIVFTRGTTEAINLVAASFLRPRLAGARLERNVLITEMEHHANIVPWQLVLEELGGRLLVAPIDDRGEVVLEEWQRLLREGVALAAFSHASNVMGTVNPAEKMVELAHAQGVPVLVDGAQAVPHFAVDVRRLCCDFYCFSGHKLFAPTGVGVLYARRELLAEMRPYQAGGNMIASVSFAGSTFAEPPARFEAGTPNISGVLGLAAALDYLAELDGAAVAEQEAALCRYALAGLEAEPELSLLGSPGRRVPVFSFTSSLAHPHDVATVLDSVGVAVRAGHHCAQPLLERLGVPAAVRASLAFYNTFDEVDRLFAGLARVREIFG